MIIVHTPTVSQNLEVISGSMGMHTCSKSLKCLINKINVCLIMSPSVTRGDYRHCSVLHLDGKHSNTTREMA